MITHLQYIVWKIRFEYHVTVTGGKGQQEPEDMLFINVVSLVAIKNFTELIFIVLIH